MFIEQHQTYNPLRKNDLLRVAWEEIFHPSIPIPPDRFKK